jgi:hypothetical protein
MKLHLFDPVRLRVIKPRQAPETKRSFPEAPALIRRFFTLLERRLVRRRSGGGQAAPDRTRGERRFEP